jgi:Tfp pilus assembly protein PilF
VGTVGYGRFRGGFAVMLAALLLTAAAGCATVEKDRQMARAHYKLGLSHLSIDSYQPAFLEFQKSLKLNPSDKEVLNAVGIVYMKLEDPAKAEESFKKAVRGDDEYSEAHNNLCFLFYDLARYEEAVNSCKKALANPLYHAPEKSYYNLGRIYASKGEYSLSVSSFRDAILRNQSFAPAYYGLSSAYNALRMYGKAGEAISRAIELDPRFKGDRDRAEDFFRQESARTDNPREAREFADYIEILHY